MSIPSTTTEIPPIVRSLAAGATLTLIEAYGVAPDRDRLEYYRRLWNET